MCIRCTGVCFGGCCACALKRPEKDPSHAPPCPLKTEQCRGYKFEQPVLAFCVGAGTGTEFLGLAQLVLTEPSLTPPKVIS